MRAAVTVSWVPGRELEVDEELALHQLGDELGAQPRHDQERQAEHGHGGEDEQNGRAQHAAHRALVAAGERAQAEVEELERRPHQGGEQVPDRRARQRAEPVPAPRCR